MNEPSNPLETPTATITTTPHLELTNIQNNNDDEQITGEEKAIGEEVYLQTTLNFFKTTPSKLN